MIGLETCEQSECAHLSLFIDLIRFLIKLFCELAYTRTVLYKYITYCMQPEYEYSVMEWNWERSKVSAMHK